MDGEREIVEGTIRSVVFHNDENGYTVLHVEIPSEFELAKNPEITIVGKAQAVWEGEEVKAEGQWVTDKVHGRQFKAETLTCIAPRSLKGIEKYLASGLIKGIGPVLAKRIVDTFGEETMMVLSHQSGRLNEVPKLGAAKIRQIRESWHQNETMRENMIFGQTYGISVIKMTKIVRKYGPDAVAIVKADPYRLCRDIWGIGFATADKIALSVGIPKDSPLRARASISYTLETEAEDGGHCWTYENDLLLHANELTGIPTEVLSAALAEEIESGRVIKETDKVYLKSLYYSERDVARRVKAILSSPSPHAVTSIANAIAWWQSRAGFELAPKQQQALTNSLKSKFSIITGGPGVGKTTIIRALVEIYGTKKLKVVLAAPTGRAAKRMTESIFGATTRGGETPPPQMSRRMNGAGASRPRDVAQTIHRLLKWNPVTNKFTFNAENRLEGDVFIFDETSMIDVKLACDLLSAIPDSAAVVWVGDTDQLPSVGAGSVLGDLIKSGAVPSTKLDFIFRQDTSGLIVTNAHHVNAGEPLEVRQGDTDFYFMRCEDPEMCVKRAIEFMTTRIPRKFGMDPLQDVQVLVPMRKNVLGTDNLNVELQKALNPHGDAIIRGGTMFRTGDRVMQLRNNYDKDVYNGDVGFVKAVNSDDRSMVVNFDGRPVKYDGGDLDELVLAYATTIHKSQGSEYPAVIVIIHTQHYVMLQRNLLYTAITRGKRLVLLMGVPYAIDQAIKTNTVRERRTSLADRLRGCGVAGFGMREKLSSRLGFILLSAGCAIGLGNVWRFPYVAGQDGGGCFAAFYLLFSLLLGIPVLMMEFAAGRAAQRSIACLHETLTPEKRLWRGHGVLGLVGSVCILIFYTTITGWTLLYFLKTASGALAGLTPDGVGDAFDAMLADPGQQIGAMAAACAIAAIVCAAGLQSGLERVAKWMMLALLLLIVALAANSVLMDRDGRGVRFFLLPDISRMRSVGVLRVAVDAMNQSFYSLSLGIGCMSIFGSYIGRERTLLGEAVHVAVLDTLVAISAGLIIIPACFAHGIELGQGPGLVFATLPNVFNRLPCGRLWGSMFFLFISFAALTSVFAVFENIVACIRDYTGWGRVATCVLTGIGLVVLSVPCVLGFNAWSGFHPFGGETNILDLEDFIVSNCMFPLGALAFAVYCCHRFGWGWKNFVTEANAGLGPKIAAWMRPYCAYVLPLIIGCIFIIGLIDRFK